MGKKTIVWAYLIVLSLGTILSLYIPKNEVAAKDAIVIPGQAIRLRILANSDLNADQTLKREVRDAVNAKISLWVKDLTSITEARKVIDSKLPEIKATAEEVVKQHGSRQTVKVRFGKVQFPTKLYGQFLYPAGDYEAVLITLGKGEGANWWCVLFPPLCFLDFSNGVAVSQGFEGQKTNKNPESAAAASSKKESAQPVSNSRADEFGQSSSGIHPKTPSGEDQTNENSVQFGESQTDGNSVQSGAGKTEGKTVGQTDGNSASFGSGQSAAISAAYKNSNSTGSEQQTDVKPAASKQKQPVSQHDSKHNKQAPVYMTEDEQPIQVKFFVLELWKKLF